MSQGKLPMTPLEMALEAHRKMMESGMHGNLYKFYNPHDSEPCCKHEWINVGFHLKKMVCKKCDIDQDKA